MDQYIIEQTANKKCFTGTTDFVSIVGASETPLMLIRNPSGSGKLLVTTHFRIGINSATTGGVIRVYKAPTVSSVGTGLTLVNSFLETTQAGSAMNMYKSPAVSSNGTLMFASVIPQSSPSKGLEQCLCLDVGQDCLVTINPNVGGVPVHCDLNWMEQIKG